MTLIRYLFVCVTIFLGLVSAHNESRRPSSRHQLNARRVSTNQALRYLSAHNEVRVQHNALPLAWSRQLSVTAEEYAKKCQFASSNGELLNGEPYGENIVAATGRFTIEKAVASFTSDQGRYNPITNPYNHWTQVVWKNTTHIGCGFASCNNLIPDTRAILHVCLYNPPGNVVDHVTDNVEL